MEHIEGMDDMRIGEPARVCPTEAFVLIARTAAARNYNRQLRTRDLDPEGWHVLSPVMIHRHAQGEEVAPHMRVEAYMKFRDRDPGDPARGIMDIPMEYWEKLPTVDELEATRDEANVNWDQFDADFKAFVDRTHRDEGYRGIVE